MKTGKRRWAVEFDWPTGYYGNALHRVGDTLILIDRLGDLHGFKLGTGRERWKATPTGYPRLSVTDAEVVAVTICQKLRCHVEVRSIEDGTVRWQAPVSSGGEYLGSPDNGDPPNRGGELWPASYVLIRTPGRTSRYTVRELATGRVVSHAEAVRASRPPWRGSC